MVLEACLARKEGGDVKIPFHRAPVRGPDVESHRQAVRDVFDASEGVEYRSEHVDSFIIAFLQREVERDRVDVTRSFRPKRLEPTIPVSTARALDTYCKPSTLICR